MLSAISILLAMTGVAWGQSGACTYALNAAGGVFPPTGGAYRITVTARAGCAWGASTAATWVHLSGANGASGNGTFTLALDSNLGSPRTADVTIAGLTFRIRQDGGSQNPERDCGSVSLNAQESSLSADGGTVELQVDAPRGCPWKIDALPAWITSAPTGGWFGPVTLTLTVPPNTGAARTAVIFVGGVRYTLRQLAFQPTDTACTYELLSSGSWVSVAGGAYQVTLATQSACQWKASSNVPWMRITGDEEGTGPASVAFTIDANPGATRIGILTIADRNYTVHQGTPSCSVTPAYRTTWLAATRGRYTLPVTLSGDCTAWSVESQAPWLRILSWTRGPDRTTVDLEADPNSGATRVATIRAGAESVEFQQSGGWMPPASCVIAPSSSGSWFAMEGGTFALEVNTSPSDCYWQATPDAAWIRVIANAAGYGPRTIAFQLDANQGPLRTGRIQFAPNVSYSVNQSPQVCTYALGSPGSWFPSVGGTFSVALTAPAGCEWRASTSASWVRITSAASGSGSTILVFSLLPNTGSFRSAAVVVEGAGFAIFQSAK